MGLIFTGCIILLMILLVFERIHTIEECNDIIENDRNYTFYLDGLDVTDQLVNIDLDNLNHYKIEIDDENQKVHLWKKLVW